MAVARGLAKSGLYAHYRFRPFDRILRAQGFCAEEILFERSVPTALRNLAREFRGTDHGRGFIIVPAPQVLFEHNSRPFSDGDYVLYGDMSYLITRTGLPDR